ncbi:MAG: hypothetical protein LiPW41_571 [Parcubacteria group bacterium LiPW_41]|nr:MAG: hypothetical protein LiPW41_571 [Parcubacteria group bacterium LiPW_41]
MSIYFTRHGRVGEENKISESGKTDLFRVKKILGELEFKPTKSFVSKAPRCIETAEILAPDAKMYPMNHLFKFGPFEKFKALSDDILGVITKFKDEDFIVVCHDDAPLVYALRLIELRGATVDWEHFSKFPHDRCVEQGEGILVSGTSYKRIHA